MKLDMRFINRPIEDLWCQAIVLFVFKGPSLLNDVLSSINEKMGGSIGDIIDKGVWTGDRGESFLLATQDAIRADKLLMRGLGHKRAFSAKVVIKESTETGIALDKIGVREFGIHMPSYDSRERKYGHYLEAAARGLVETFYKRHQGDPDFLLKIFFSIDKGLVNHVEPVIKKLKESMLPGLEFSIMSERKANKDYEE